MVVFILYIIARLGGEKEGGVIAREEGRLF